ncbi:MAG: MFS transporter [Termitinemataceae bacterium]|nr:MAG: MFS transporter [Termitinemataceae bacterium]
MDNQIKTTRKPYAQAWRTLIKDYIFSIYRRESKPLRFVIVLVLAGIAGGLYKGVQDNYLVEILHITPFERGIVEFFRELPGFLLVFILALMYRLSESRIFKIGNAVMLAGMIGLLLCKSEKFIVVVFMVLWSIGEHIVLPLKNSISLDFAKAEKSGASLGLTSTITNLGNIAGFIAVTVLFFILGRLGFTRTDTIPFRIVFATTCALMIGASLTALAISETKTQIKRRRFYFAKKYNKYYVLEILYGARKQVFFTFGPLVLIKEYGANTSIIAMLLAISAAFGMFFSPLIGKLIDKLGYKSIMVADTLILIVVCFFYGFSHRIFSVHIAFFAVCVNYIADAILSLCSMASNVYAKSISDNQEELTSTLSTGISVNHFISIFVALLGGYIWNITGIEVLFSISALLGLINSLFAATIKPRHT